MGALTRFKNSTMQQVFAILIVVIGAVVIAFIKVPYLTVYTYSWKLNWDNTYNSMDVLDGLMTIHEPNVLDVLFKNMNDDRKLKEQDIVKREDFEYEEKDEIGEYCVYLFLKFTEYDFEHELPYKRDVGKYQWQKDFATLTKWMETNLKDLVWYPQANKFVHKDSLEEREDE